MARYSFAVMTFTTLLLVWTADGCPAQCSCYRTTVRCMLLNLEFVPNAIPPRTTILDLRFNRIKKITPGSLSHLKYLETILLNNNRIRRVVDGAFSGLQNLQSLYLYKNQIGVIESKALHGMPQLRHLYLHFNEIQKLPHDLFARTPNLERLFLNNNHLQRLPFDLLRNVKNLQRLRLDSNALICDCELYWLADMLASRRPEAAVTCHGPEEVRGMPLLAVREEHFHCRRPVLVATPHDVEVSWGNTAYFVCRADGSPSPRITWLHNDDEIRTNSLDPSSRYNILADGSLMILDAQDSDAGVYECVASNVAGEARTDRVHLTYTGRNAGARLMRRPADATLLQGDPLTLECAAAGHPTPRVDWTKDGLPLAPDDRITVKSHGSLVFSGVIFEDRGEYECHAENADGEDWARATLTVHVEPHFTQRPTDTRVVEGDQLQLMCLVQGFPLPRLEWRKDGRTIPAYGRLTISGDRSTLLIHDTRLSDAGVYECEAVNIAGRRVVNARLDVASRAPPQLVRLPTDHRVPVHGRIDLHCAARGDPQPVISWHRNSAPITPDERTFISADGDLAIYSVQFSDEGLYECAAENSAGITRAVAQVTVLEADVVYIGDRFVDASIQEAIIAVNRAFNNTLRELRDPTRPRTPHELLALFRLPSSPAALDITRSAEIYERALDIVLQHLRRAQLDGRGFDMREAELVDYEELISPSHLAIISSLSGCSSHRRGIACDDMCHHAQYRSHDGTCNNLAHPMRGASLTALARLAPPAYQDGLHLPVGWDPLRLHRGYLLPSARMVSTRLIASEHVSADADYSGYVMQWGQFVDHDLDFSPMAVSNARFSDGRRCNETCDNEAPCFPIRVPSSDPRITRHRCLGVTRSSAMCGSGSTSVFFNKVRPRQQLNQITSYMDGSNVYGSSEHESLHLRDLVGERGQLRQGLVQAPDKHLLPFSTNTPVDCQIDPTNTHVPCFLAGDHRANEQLGLLATHTLWMRQHNRVARQLVAVNPHWPGDTLYQEARKLVTAQLQHITYSHWLPKILGESGMSLIPPYQGYDPNTDASILNEFSTAAFRFGHSLVNPVVYRLNSTMQTTEQGHLPLHRAFFAPFRIVEEGGIDPVIRGLYGRPGKQVRSDELLNTELTERLFMLAHDVSLDLAALNIQRGRDHGLQPYNEYRVLCNLSRAHHFNDFSGQISNVDVRRQLRDLYGHPGNVDLWVGGLVEDPVPGGRVGPTFACIIGQQFRRLRDGDRFWYENPGVFSPAQVTSIKQSNLARVICDNADNIRHIPPDVFSTTQYPQGYVSCEDDEKIPRVELKVWSHCSQERGTAAEFLSNHIAPRRRARRSTEHSYPADRPAPNGTHHSYPAYRPAPTGNDHSYPADRRAPTGTMVLVYDPEPYPLNNVTFQPALNHSNNMPRNPVYSAAGEIGSGEAYLDESLNLPNAETTSHSDGHDMMDMMDVMDIRIEGVERVMERLGRTVRKLNKKVKSLEALVGNGASPRVVCLDDFENTRADEETWSEHDCRKCACKGGQVECITERCPVPSCDNPRKIKGVCCLQC